MTEEDKTTLHTQLNNICSLLNGTWQHSSTVNSRGERGEKITIYYSNSDASGSDNGDT